MDRRLLLVGSLPAKSAEEAFTKIGSPLGEHLFCIPDGEFGPRAHWISRVHYQIFAGHADLDVLSRPARNDGVEQLFARNNSDRWQFAVKSEIDQVRFADPGWRLGFARDAVTSYFAFKTLKEKGVLPQHLRFQVSIPLVNSIVPPKVIPSLADLAKLKPGLEAALGAEVMKIVEMIPAEELALQWDCSSEVHDAYGNIAEFGKGDWKERNLGQVRRLSAHIPETVALGYHFCFGTLGGWPRFAPDDLGPTVELANAFVEASGRRVDWVHIPVLDRSDDAFYAPLAKLSPHGARVYLGTIHNMERFDARVETARRYVPDFGMAAFCGFGRALSTEVSQIVGDHLRAAQI